MRLENWFLSRPHAFNPYSPPEVVGMVINGEVYGNEHFKDGEFVTTSKINKIEDGKVYTCNSMYELGDVDPKYLEAFPNAIKLTQITPKIKDIWVSTHNIVTPEYYELIVEFDNDRKHALKFKVGDKRDTVVSNLLRFAKQIEDDENLDGT